MVRSQVKLVGGFLLFFIFLLALWQGILFINKLDTVEKHYPTFAAAEADQLFAKGWLPRIIPPSSYNIKTRNDLNLNTSQGSFSFQKKDLSKFLSHLTNAPDLSSEKGEVYHYQNWTFTLSTQGTFCEYRLKI